MTTWVISLPRYSCTFARKPEGHSIIWGLTNKRFAALGLPTLSTNSPREIVLSPNLWPHDDLLDCFIAVSQLSLQSRCSTLRLGLNAHAIGPKRFDINLYLKYINRLDHFTSIDTVHFDPTINAALQSLSRDEDDKDTLWARNIMDAICETLEKTYPRRSPTSRKFILVRQLIKSFNHNAWIK